MNLVAGDIVDVVAPASHMAAENFALLEKSQQLLESWGLVVRLKVSADNHFYLAGDDTCRGALLKEALESPESKAIFCTRGGYGSPRLLRQLHKLKLASPKFLIGFSDITSLHLALNRLYPEFKTIHAPNIATVQFLGNNKSDSAEINQQALYDFLFRFSDSLTKCQPRFCETLTFIKPTQTKAQGILVGGCLSLVVNSIGTPYFPNCDGAILFLEEIAEKPYQIDRMLHQLINAGVMDKINGLVFGDMVNCVDGKHELFDIVKDTFQDFSFPIAYGLPCGHGAVNKPLQLGIEYILDSLNCSLSSIS
jgi:muramoyltetrapeptide carboxypeptidase